MNTRQFLTRRSFRFSFLAILCFFSTILNAQVRIKERVEIAPKAPMLSIAGDGGSLFLPFGGIVKLYLYFSYGEIHPDATIGFELWQTSPEYRMLYTGVGPWFGGIPIPLGYYSAGATISFKIKILTNVEGYGFPIGEYFQEPANSPKFKYPYSFIYFDFYRNNKPEQFYEVLDIDIYPDSTSAIDLRPAAGPPREAVPFIVPSDGQIIVEFYHGDYDLVDTIKFRSSRDSLVIDPSLMYAISWDYCPAINFGYYNAGDTLFFPLSSAVPSAPRDIYYRRLLLCRIGL